MLGPLLAWQGFLTLLSVQSFESGYPSDEILAGRLRVPRPRHAARGPQRQADPLRVLGEVGPRELRTEGIAGCGLDNCVAQVGQVVQVPAVGPHPGLLRGTDRDLLRLAG